MIIPWALLVARLIRTFVVSGTGFLALAVLLLASAGARADIFEIEAATSCPGSAGGGLCNGAVPYNLQSLLSGGLTVGSGTTKFVVTDTIGSFSFVLTGITGHLDNGDPGADNGSCQINGGAASLFNACTGVNADNGSFSLGHDDTNHPGVDPPTTLTFTADAGDCTAAHPCSFDLGFVSMQGTTTLSATPLPGALPLMAPILAAGYAFLRRRGAAARRRAEGVPAAA